jgi:hypothetical protein
MSIFYIETHLHNSHCQFVYHGNVGGICRAWNNIYSIFIPSGCKRAKQKVPKYGIIDSDMLLYNMMSILYKSTCLTNQPTMLNLPTCNFPYHFVSRRSVGSIGRTRNNKGSIFSPPGRKPSGLHISWVYILPFFFCNPPDYFPYAIVKL